MKSNLQETSPVGIRFSFAPMLPITEAGGADSGRAVGDFINLGEVTAVMFNAPKTGVKRPSDPAPDV